MSPRIVSWQTAPCGCRFSIDVDGVAHIDPCRDSCPNVAVLTRELLHVLPPGTPVHDVRELEEQLGRRCGPDDVAQRDVNQP